MNNICHSFSMEIFVCWRLSVSSAWLYLRPSDSHGWSGEKNECNQCDQGSWWVPLRQGTVKHRVGCSGIGLLRWISRRSRCQETGERPHCLLNYNRDIQLTTAYHHPRSLGRGEGRRLPLEHRVPKISLNCFIFDQEFGIILSLRQSCTHESMLKVQLFSFTF